MRHLLLFLCTSLPMVAMAAMDPAAPRDLPSAESAQAVLASHPDVRVALAALAAARAQAEKLSAGDYELGVRVTGQRRSIVDGADYSEWQAGIERPVRLLGKARLDRGIGSAGVAEAEERVGDARHEAARTLLTRWYAVHGARSESELWRKQVEILERELDIVDRRVKGGDAARIDRVQAEAALAQARATQQQAEDRLRRAQAELSAQYPGLTPPADVRAEPSLPSGTADDWVRYTLDHNHELLALGHALEQARLQAERFEADRVPDPTVGVHVGSEQGGDERLVGASLSIPLAGRARTAQAQQQRAVAEATAQKLDGARRRLAAEAAINWQRASSGIESYRSLKTAAEASLTHAALAQRAHELGELGLAEALLARRQALDAQLQAEQARLTANEAIARLLLDAHRLWALATPEDEHAH